MQPVNYQLAQECLDLYQQTYSAAVVTNRMTDSVGFMKTQFVAWLTQLHEGTDYDELRMCLGMYTKEILEAYEMPAILENRVTIFVYPYTAGVRTKWHHGVGGDEPCDPFNMGTVQPTP